MAHTLADIVVVGSINADLTARVARHPKPGETLLGTGGTITAGGKGANQAVAAALQGASVALVGAVGSDAYAAPALTHVRSSGVNQDYIAQTQETTGLAVITVSDDGENSIIVIPGANATVDKQYVAGHEDLIAGAKIMLLQGEIPADGFAAAVALARKHGVRVITNLAPVIEVDREALLAADPIMANEHEAGLILEQLGTPIDSEDPHELATALLNSGFHSVVLTLGSKGALVACDGELTDIPTPKVEAVDTTGAGDSFAGAFCARVVAGDSDIAAAQHAARVGAFATTKAGAQASYPSRDDVLPALSE